MKRFICLLIVSLICFGAVGCNSSAEPTVTDADDETDVEETDPAPEDFNPDKVVRDICSFDTISYDLKKLITSGTDFKVTKDGQELDGMNVPLSVGVNVFHVTYKIASIERKCEQ